MTLRAATLAGLFAMLTASCSHDFVGYERQLERSFTVTAGAVVLVNLDGGTVTAATGRSNVVHLTLWQEIYAASDEEAKEVLAQYDISATRQNGNVTLNGRLRRDADRSLRRGVRFRAVIEVPADVRLDLRTSGGSVTVGGDRSASLRANTSGGSVIVDGGMGPLDLRTSGGHVDVGRALGELIVSTSGGGITIGHLGESVARVDLDTSGGSIHAEVSPVARFDLNADTSGGQVVIEGLPVDITTPPDQRSRVRGRVNGGGPPWRVRASGGNIVIRGAAPGDAASADYQISTMAEPGGGADIRVLLP